jgi:hypothetical protein
MPFDKFKQHVESLRGSQVRVELIVRPICVQNCETPERLVPRMNCST